MAVVQTIITEPRRWFRRLSVQAKTSVICLCALVLAAAGFGVYSAVPSAGIPFCMNQGANVVARGGPNSECIGVSDGSFVFDPLLASVENDIRQENHQVTAAHPDSYVSVVILLPISADSGSIMSDTNDLEQLRGAYTAQYYANRNDVDGITPYIQLLVGNDGYQANQWSQAVSIIENAATAQHIAAVTGIGVSLATTLDAVKRLTSDNDKMPVFGATITSDDFDNVPDLVRVAPSNKDEISVAVGYIQSLFSRAILVEDQNNRDIYDSTLVSAFQKFSDSTHTIVGREPYDTTYRDLTQSAPAQQAEQTVENRISQMTTDICGAQPAAVLFAGRGGDLAELVSDLGNRPCLNVPITIISGDDVSNMPVTATVRQGLASGVTLDYAGIAHPAEWTGGTGAAVAEGRQGFATFNTVFQKLFPGAGLTDGNTMTAYDAAMLGVSAIRLTLMPQPTPKAVDGMLGTLQGAHTVLGASGPLSYVPDYGTSETASNPVGKAIPILRVGPDGIIRFVTLSWPEGEPSAF
jgi:hypothetical protein